MASGTLLELPGNKTQMFQCVITITALCKCGNPEPITVIMLVGVPFKAYCPRCDTKFSVASIRYNVQENQPLTIALIEESAKIQAPPPGLKVS